MVIVQRLVVHGLLRHCIQTTLRGIGHAVWLILPLCGTSL